MADDFGADPELDGKGDAGGIGLAPAGFAFNEGVDPFDPLGIGAGGLNAPPPIDPTLVGTAADPNFGGNFPAPPPSNPNSPLFDPFGLGADGLNAPPPAPVFDFDPDLLGGRQNPIKTVGTAPFPTDPDVGPTNKGGVAGLPPVFSPRPTPPTFPTPGPPGAGGAGGAGGAIRFDPVFNIYGSQAVAQANPYLPEQQQQGAGRGRNGYNPFSLLPLLAAFANVRPEQEGLPEPQKGILTAELAHTNLRNQLIDQFRKYFTDVQGQITPFFQQRMDLGSPYYQARQREAFENLLRQYNDAASQLQQRLAARGLGYAPSGMTTAAIGDLERNQAQQGSEEYLQNMFQNENLSMQAAQGLMGEQQLSSPTPLFPAFPRTLPGYPPLINPLGQALQVLASQIGSPGSLPGTNPEMTFLDLLGLGEPGGHGQSQVQSGSPTNTITLNSQGQRPSSSVGFNFSLPTEQTPSSGFAPPSLNFLGTPGTTGTLGAPSTPGTPITPSAQEPNVPPPFGGFTPRSPVFTPTPFGGQATITPVPGGAGLTPPGLTPPPRRGGGGPIIGPRRPANVPGI